jgi:hypothetical protein
LLEAPFFDLFSLFVCLFFFSLPAFLFFPLSFFSFFSSFSPFVCLARQENGIFYLSLIVIFVALFLYLVFGSHLTPSHIKDVAIAASNTWGMLLLVFLLGYGLVDVPRFLWRRANYAATLRLYPFPKKEEEKRANEQTHHHLLPSVFASRLKTNMCSVPRFLFFPFFFSVSSSFFFFFLVDNQILLSHFKAGVGMCRLAGHA